MSSDTPPDSPQENDVEAQQSTKILLAEVSENCGIAQATQFSAEQQMANFIVMFLEKYIQTPSITYNTEDRIIGDTIPRIIIETQSDAEGDMIELVRQFLEKHPVVQTIVGDGLSPFITRKQAGVARLRNKAIDDENNRAHSNPDLVTAFDEMRTELDKVVSERNQLYTLLGHMVCQPDFFDNKHSLLVAECNWPFTKDDVRAAATEWIRSNDFITYDHVSRFPEATSSHLWLLSVSNPALVDYQALTEWMLSAQHHFQDVGSLRFLITVLWNLLLIPRLSTDHIWVATRLLEFFVILDKDSILDTSQLLEFHDIIFEQGFDVAHLIPFATLAWIQQKLEKTPITRGDCLLSFYDDHYKFYFGDGIYGTPVEGVDEPYVAIMGAVDKYYRCPISDVSVHFNDNLDIVVSFKGYDRCCVVDATDPEEYSFVTWAFPHLNLQK